MQHEADYAVSNAAFLVRCLGIVMLKLFCGWRVYSAPRTLIYHENKK